MLSQLQGPLVVGNSLTGTAQQDVAPSVFMEGTALFDPRSTYKYGAGAENKAIACYAAALSGKYLVVDQVPSTIATNNIAAAANAVTGTAMVLVNGTGGAGITKLASALTIPQTGNIVPTAALVVDGTPAIVTFGTQGTIALADPTKAIARAVSITGVAGGTGGAFKIVGYDLYGNLTHETVTATSGATTTNSVKTYKFIASVTPQFSDAHNYSVGTTDIYGFPMRVDTFGYVMICWSAGFISSNAGFTGAVSTTGTATSSDVRGKYATQTDASDGTKRMTIFVSVSPTNITSITGLFGVAQFTG